ncbi:hypothetical protein QJS10_CPA06g00492 [Acorus calamus]|uniref:50S ribosomal protein L18 n=1 Tax=Acorus calamus TaxID=4465 RepID=A0AAV9EJ23_ACOCL|nr:hypothetical protein QJS10_CPA06g00492 [Acorus calamus]
MALIPISQKLILMTPTSSFLGTSPSRLGSLPCLNTRSKGRPLIIKAKSRANTRTESAVVLNRRMRRKEAAQRVGEELVKTCVELNINEISTYDQNGFARGERMEAFEVEISQHGFLLR